MTRPAGWNKRNLVLVGLVLLLGLALWLRVDFALARFHDETSQSLSKSESGAAGPQPDFRPGTQWFVFLEGPSFFRRLAGSHLPQMLRLSVQSPELHVQFLDSFPVDPVNGSFLYAQFSGRGLWMSNFARYEDCVQWAFSSDGTTAWIHEGVVTFDSPSGPMFMLGGTLDNEGYAVGVLSLEAYWRHRTSLVLGKVVDSVSKACRQVREGT